MFHKRCSSESTAAAGALAGATHTTQQHPSHLPARGAVSPAHLAVAELRLAVVLQHISHVARSKVLLQRPTISQQALQPHHSSSSSVRLLGVRILLLHASSC